jgi:hypothetical protein
MKSGVSNIMTLELGHRLDPEAELDGPHPLDFHGREGVSGSEAGTRYFP